MTEILERRRRERTVERLPTRVDALGRVVELATGRVPDELVVAASGVVERAGRRIHLSPDHTVVALAGSTGSGKSSLFNAIAELDLATVGVRRPTTSSALACVWGAEGSGEILTWLQIDRRHQVMRSSELEDDDESDLRGLVLLDLPDHDSTEPGHQLEVRRLVELVDMLVWVIDPQKYADAALHDDFLRPLAGHADVMAFVLNQADRLGRRDADECVRDLRRLLADDGIADPTVVLTSATSGLGVHRLRALLAERVLERRSSVLRVSADLTGVAGRLAEHVGAGDVAPPTSAELGALRDGVAQAAGVDGIAVAAGRSYATRATASTGWPPLRWLARVRPDPLRRLGLDRGGAGERLDLVRSSRAPATAAQRAQVDTAVRRFAGGAAAGLPTGWAASTRAAARSRADDLTDAVDSAIALADLGTRSTPTWWRLLSAVQWALLAALVVGIGWLALLAVGQYVGLPDVPTPRLWGVGVPLLLVAGGAVLGVLVALLARPARALGARRVQRRVHGRLRDDVAAVADDLVVTPVRAELDRLRDVRTALAEVAKTR